MNPNSDPQANADTEVKSAPIAPPRFPFAILFLVWILVFMTATLVTFIIPESYSSTARIRIERDQTDVAGFYSSPGPQAYDPYFIQTEFEVLQSEAILRKVIAALDLNQEWGRKYGGGDPLKTTESMGILKGRMDLRPVTNTSLIEIRVFSEAPEEAAKVANALATTYRDYRSEERVRKISTSVLALEQAYEANQGEVRKLQADVASLSREPNPANTNRLDEARSKVEELQRFGQILFTKLEAEKTDLSLPATSMVQIVDQAVPGVRPVRPNKPLNIAIAIILGAVSGLVLATLVFVLQRRAFRRDAGLPRKPLPPRLRVIAHILIALIVGFAVGHSCPKSLASFYCAFLFLPSALIIGVIACAYTELASVPSESK